VHARESDAGVAIAVPPIEIDTLVPCSPGAAFDYFTRDIGRWWPLARYSCSQAQARGVAFEAAGAFARVRLVHSGWEALGAQAAETRESYANGWPNVMGKPYKGYCEGVA